MTWLYLVIAAQFLNALVVLFDKFLVTRVIGRPIVYAFYVSMLSGVVVVLLPFGVVSVPTLSVSLLALGVAITFLFFILLFYSALRAADASDVAPVLGAVAAIATLLFSLLLIQTNLPRYFLIGFGYLILGTLLTAYYHFNRRSAAQVILAGVFFGLSSVLIKILFSQTEFFNGFFWSRLANVVVALGLLAWPTVRQGIIMDHKKSPIKTKSLVVLNKGLAGGAFFLLLAAIKLGEVSVVNALTGIQFVFLLIFAFIFSKKFPDYFRESSHHRHVIARKIISAGLIIVGFFFLFI